MKFQPLPLEGASLISLKQISDERGFFSRLFCQETLQKAGLDPGAVQANHSFSKEAGTLRGMHFQLPPFEETKLIRCLKGELYDVMIDIRPSSATYKQWYGKKLSEKKPEMLFIPKGFAHGFLTLSPNTELLYFVSAPYQKTHERGISYNDPNFSITWPTDPKIVSERDLSHPPFEEHALELAS